MNVEKTWYDFLHRCRTVKEGVEWLKPGNEDKPKDASGKKTKSRRKKSNKDDSTDVARELTRFAT